MEKNAVVENANNIDLINAYKTLNNIVPDYSISHLDSAIYGVRILCNKGEFYDIVVTKTIVTDKAPYIRKKHIQPAPISASMENQIIDFAVAVVREMKVDNGPLYIEIIQDENSELRLFDVSSGTGYDGVGDRLPGYRGKSDISGEMIREVYGNEPKVGIKGERSIYECVYLLTYDDALILNNILEKNPQDVLEIGDYSEEQLDRVTSNEDRAGYYIAKYNPYIRIAELMTYLEKSKKVSEELWYIISSKSVDIYTAMAINYNIFSKGGPENNYEIRMKIHRFIYNELRDEFSLDEYMPRPLSEREKVVVIMSEDIVYLSHGDKVTRTYDMLEKMGYIPVIACFPVTIPDEDSDFCKLMLPLRAEGVNGSTVVNIKDKSYRYLQLHLAKSQKAMIGEGIRAIYDLNPMFVLAIGVQSPIADLLQSFTDVISGSMFSQPPVSVCRKLISRFDNEDDFEYYKSFYDKDVEFCNDGIGLYIDEPASYYCKKDLGIDENEFLISLVGIRLDDEVDENELLNLKRISEINDRISFAIIGATKTLEERMKSCGLKVHNLGMQSELIKVFNAVDVFYNPKRYGGGLSALYAAAAGVPVVTLGGCDVASNMGEEFIFESVDGIIDEINKYLKDDDYFNSKKLKSKDVVTELNNNCKKSFDTIINQFIFGSGD